MNLDKAIQYIKENNGAVYAYDELKREVFFIDFEDSPERFAPVIVYYSKYGEQGTYDRYEDIFPVEEYFDMFPNSAKFTYFPIGKDALGFMNDEFEFVLEYFKSNTL